MAWVKDQQWLFAGTAGGLIGWHLPIKVLTGSVPSQPPMIDFELVPDSEHREYGQAVDSVCSLGQGLVATKCVAYGKILVFKAEFPALQEKYRTGNLCKDGARWRSWQSLLGVTQWSISSTSEGRQTFV